MAQEQVTERETATADDDFGWFGWISVAGFVIMGLLYLLDTLEIADSILSPTATLIVALVAGIGALLLYFGNDPTA